MTRGPNAPRIPYLDGTPRRRIQSHGISCCSSWLAWKRFFADAFYADDWRVDISAQAASFGPEPLLVRLHHLASSLLHRPLPLSGTPFTLFPARALPQAQAQTHVVWSSRNLQPLPAITNTHFQCKQFAHSQIYSNTLFATCQKPL